MQIKKHWKTATKIVGVLLVAAIVLFGLLPLLLPFVLGYLLALAAEPLVRLLQKRTSLPRWACGALCVTALFAVVGVCLFFLCRVLFSEATSLVARLPALLSELQLPMQRLQNWLDSLVSRAPDGLSETLRSWVDSLFAGSSAFAQTLYRTLADFVSNLLSGLPGMLLGIVTTVLSTYMLCACLPQMKAYLKAHLPEKWSICLGKIRSGARGALGGWCKAQLVLMGIVFAFLTIGFWILGVEFPLLLGALIALLDALPVLGAGAFLVPWSLLSFLQSDTRMGVGLLVIYLLEVLTRSAIEPRLVGRQIGLHPLMTLLAFYVGYRLMGVAGMLLFPICAILIKQFLELTELIPTQKTGVRNAQT